MIVSQSKLPSQNSHARSYVMTDINNEITNDDLNKWLFNVAEQRCKQSFAALFKYFVPKIQGIARQKLANESVVNEVVQETMTKVWRKANLFDANKGAASTWIYTVMRNVIFDHLRKVQNNREDQLSEDIWPLVEGTTQEHEIFPDHLENQQLMDAINELPINQRDVLRGFYLQEMSQEQLATHLNLPLGTVKSRLRLALSKLKQQLGDKHD